MPGNTLAKHLHRQMRRIWDNEVKLTHLSGLIRLISTFWHLIGWPGNMSSIIELLDHWCKYPRSRVCKRQSHSNEIGQNISSMGNWISRTYTMVFVKYLSNTLYTEAKFVLRTSKKIQTFQTVSRWYSLKISSAIRWIQICLDFCQFSAIIFFTNCPRVAEGVNTKSA